MPGMSNSGLFLCVLYPQQLVQNVQGRWAHLTGCQALGGISNQQLSDEVLGLWADGGPRRRCQIDLCHPT